MLVLSRRSGESIRVGDDIEIQVLLVKGTGDQAVVRLGIKAPRSVTILRDEVYQDVVEANRQSLQPEGALPESLLNAVRPESPAEGRGRSGTDAT